MNIDMNTSDTVTEFSATAMQLLANYTSKTPSQDTMQTFRTIANDINDGLIVSVQTAIDKFEIAIIRLIKQNKLTK